MKSHFSPIRWLTVLILCLTTFSLASSVTAQDNGIPVRFEGTIETIKDNAITVDAFVVNISKITLETKLQEGMVVKVEGLLTANNVINATAVTVVKEAPSAAEESTFTFAGVVDKLDGTSMVVNGLTVDVSKAEIDKGVAEGDIVKLHAQSGVVNKVELIETDDVKEEDRGEFKLTATVTKVSDNHILVAGITIITVEAEKQEKALKKDALVKVEGVIIEDVFIANKTEVFEKPDRDEEFDIRGRVQKVDGKTLIVSGLSIELDEKQEQLKPGVRVHVTGRITNDKLVADAVEVFGNPEKDAGN